jgi:hypothetical protein
MIPLLPGILYKVNFLVDLERRQPVMEEDREALERRLHTHPRLAQGYQLKQRFQALLAQGDVEAFHAWLDGAEASGVPSFQAVAHGFRHDIEAIIAALTMPWSTCQCAGQICRVKLIKRLGYGRAKVDLLRQRLLHWMVVPGQAPGSIARATTRWRPEPQPVRTRGACTAWSPAPTCEAHRGGLSLLH